MRGWFVGQLLLLTALAPLGGCKAQETHDARDTALADDIDRLVETFLTSEDQAKEASALSEARVIFEREGVPTIATVGDTAAYGFVIVNMLGQSPPFRAEFLASVRKAASRHELPQDAVAFAEAPLRQTTLEERFKDQVPSRPALRDEISRLFKNDQAVREKKGFDLEKMKEVDGRTARPLKAMFDRYGVPTYEMVGVQATKAFVVMVQHQSAEFRQAVLPTLKAAIDAGQADPADYAMVYDRSQRDQGQSQLYGAQLECTSGHMLSEAPINDEATVNTRRAELGLIRVELYARLVRLFSPDMCTSDTSSQRNSSASKR